MSFLVVDAQGRVVTLPTAKVFVADALDAAPFLETQGKLERIGVPGGDEADATHIYVAHLKLPRSGKFWMLAEPEGGNEKVQALGNVVVVSDDAPPDVGDPAMASDTPTLASAGGHAAAITTRTPPDESLLQYSVADSLSAKVPFVVTFATPKFCSSRTCGPVVDVVEEVQQPARRREGSFHPRRGVQGERSRPKASTGGCGSGTSRRSRGRSSSGRTGRSRSASRERSP